MAEPTQTHSIISADAVITGTIQSSSGIQIDGKFEGEIRCESDVIVGKTAVIKGNFNVNSITVSGTINGNITARDRIELKSSAKLLGDIKSKRLAVEDGVTFIGRSEVNPSGGALPGASKSAEGGGEPPKKDSGK
ncbi:MAG: cytoskeletal protein CcmA (bactofilin family) [Kiritimatiellia bacterium]|jgi:cytoskeletal protein CcmA (bactofilin family)